MEWRDVFAIIVALLIVFFVVRSFFTGWKAQGDVPLEGKLQELHSWLVKSGYQVIRGKTKAEWYGYYDKRRFHKNFHADFIVRQGAKVYAVKMANPREPDISGVRLRDEWQPFVYAFRVNGILHVNMDVGTVNVIDFEMKSPAFVQWRTVVNRTLWFLAGALMSFAWLHKG